MARRLEDGALVFWAPCGALTVRLSVFGLGGDGSSREERLAEIERDRTPAATGVRLDRGGSGWRMSYRLGESADDDRADAF